MSTVSKFLKKLDLSKLGDDLKAVLAYLGGASSSTSVDGLQITTSITAAGDNGPELTLEATRAGQEGARVELVPLVLFGASATTAQTVDYVVALLAKWGADSAMVASVVAKVAGLLSVVEAL